MIQEPMFAERRKSLLLTLVACIQLVLAPALRPADCGDGGSVGGDSCCCEVRAPAAAGATVADDSCCGQLEAPAPDGDEDGGRDGCHCAHVPLPTAPDIDERATPVDPAPLGAAPLAQVGTVDLPPPCPTLLVARHGPPGDPGPALHLLHCVFLN